MNDKNEKMISGTISNMNKVLQNFRKWISNNIHGDRYIWVITFLLTLGGSLVIYSSVSNIAHKNLGGDTEHYLFKQFFLVIITFMVIWATHKIEFKHFFAFSKILIILAITLLFVTLFVGQNINSATRWINIPIINQSFQPSEFANFALIVWLAYKLSNSQKDINNFKKTVLPIFFVVGLVVLLIASNNVSSAIMIFIVSLFIIIIGRLSLTYISISCLVGLSIIIFAIIFGERGGTAVKRFKDYYFSDKIPYQVEHSYIAIAGGGITGIGAGQSQQKYILPHPYSDFIFPILVEEYGVIGAVVLVFLYLALLNRCIVIAKRTQHMFGKLLSIGLGLSIVIHALINIGVTVGITPPTGIPLPFFSMGGSSLLFSGLSVGAILSVSTKMKKA